MKEVQLPKDLLMQAEQIEREIQKNMSLRYQLLSGFAYAHGFQPGDKLEVNPGPKPGEASLVFGKDESVKENVLQGQHTYQNAELVEPENNLKS